MGRGVFLSIYMAIQAIFRRVFVQSKISRKLSAYFTAIFYKKLRDPSINIIGNEMRATVIDSLYNENHALIEYLKDKGEISFLNNVDAHFRKTLLLSIASYFETIIKESLIVFFGEKTNKAELILRFIENKAIERQYHTYFTWDANNANSFFGLFGSEFKEYMKAEVKTNTELDDSIRAFLRLGNYRNQLVHQNFATFPLESTADEIYTLYKKALLFMSLFPQKLREYKEK